MNTILKNTVAGTVLGGGLLFTAGLGLANAQPAETPDGLVTVAVGNTAILEAVDAETAATAAGAICGTPASDVTALVEQVDTEGTEQTVCEGLPGGALAIKNGVPAAAEAPAAEAPVVTPGGTDDVQLPAEGESSQTAPADTAPIG
ncbi:hypothetical protein [Mycolicibacterium litorale]|uniref:Secreted protein n=1 Tax=Mycolicibacterium litorale TaxID=758802 RepID=A0AAD1ILD2_9MYCO|nr:hypothetical protein [Mycolicibacterium litorale]MCV7416253.1 hypothetical protein [Mycolicibacterium litorale]TDY09504.1 hypothetical protein BCL50_1597 [Mycolicibacterium litorale]BBY17450.1 hypothetical protein MLIT_30420 [Mycolicibacterium litorale]